MYFGSGKIFKKEFFKEDKKGREATGGQPGGRKGDDRIRHREGGGRQFLKRMSPFNLRIIEEFFKAPLTISKKLITSKG